MTPWKAVEAAQRMAETLKIPCSNVRHVEWCEGYADGRKAPKGIAYANWNDDDSYDHNTREHVKAPGRIMSRLCTILERMGVEIEWSDMVSTCDGCGLLIRTEPDSYSWQPDFVVDDCEITCAACLEGDPEAYLESLEGDPDRCNTLAGVKPGEHGYTVFNAESYESGWHPGQDDSPKKVARELEAKGVTRYLFQLDENSQFYSKWSVYVHADETDLLTGKGATDGDDNN